MSQIIYGIFNPGEIVQDTMEKLIEQSIDALHTNFEGDGDMPSGIDLKSSQWCSNKGENLLKIRTQDNNFWKKVYDFAAGHVYLETGQVGSDHINDAAKKVSLIANQDIAPKTCTKQAKFLTVSLPGVPNELFDLISLFGHLGGGGWKPIYTSKIYVPDDAGILYIRARQTTCFFHFRVGGSTSSTSSTEAGPAWGTEAFLDLSSPGITGWQDIIVEAQSSRASVPYGSISGLTSRWEVPPVVPPVP